MRRKWVVVVDGPSGAGKSTIGRLLAKRLKYTYLDSGALYRCITLAALEKGISPKNSKELYRMAKGCAIAFKNGRLKQYVSLNRKDVTKKIREPRISQQVSAYAKLKVVRQALLYHQRHLGKKGGIVGEGRDLGTVVFPKADIKFFMVATLKERARRRYLELKNKFKKTSLKEIERAIRKRDKIDSSRALAPLKKAKDAIRIDTTCLTIDQVADRMYSCFVRKKALL